MATGAPRILVIDDDPSLRDLVALRLGKAGYAVEQQESAASALRSLASEEFDAVLTDIRMDEMDGITLCERVSLDRPDLPVIVMTAHSSLDTALGALRAKAFDFLQKPFEATALLDTVAAAVRHSATRRHLRYAALSSPTSGTASGASGGTSPGTAGTPPGTPSAPPRPRAVDNMIGASPAFMDLMDMAARVAPMDTTVLIVGESGTGKELVARSLHEGNERSKTGSFVAINCAAMPENLLEAELFGHVKGAFTDARSDREGLFEQARGGTLFLDELGELPLHLQPKLLRALQERKVRRIGGTREISTDVRLVAATNADLSALVKEGRFREDLFYRINVIELKVPPLRERGHDVLLCAAHFLRTRAGAGKEGVRGITPEAAERLLGYPWPGNVRELQNTIERAVALARHEEITVSDLPASMQRYRASPRRNAAGEDTLRSLAEVEHDHITRVLQATNGNKTLAAQILGVDRRTLYRKSDRYDARGQTRGG